MEPADRTLMNHHREQSRQHFDAMKLLSDDLPSYGIAVALLAIHSALSLADAVRACHIGRCDKFDDHAEAVRELERFCRAGRERLKYSQLADFKKLHEADIRFGD